MPKINRHGQARCLSTDDYEKLLSVIRNPKHRIFMQIARYTGEQWGVICRLKIQDVYAENFPLEQINFESKDRQILVCPALDIALRAYPHPPTGWLFPNRVNKSQPMSFRNADRFFRLAIEKAGLGEGFSTHSTRRTFVIMLAQSGIRESVIQRITGYKDLKSLQDYAEVNDEQIKNALSFL